MEKREIIYLYVKWFLRPMIFLSYIWILVCELLLIYGVAWGLIGGILGFVSLITSLLSDVVFLNYAEGYWRKRK